MKTGDVSKTPFKIGDNYYIVGVTRREDADNAEFAKQHSALLEQALNKKQGAVFGDFLAAAKQKFESDGSIKVYQEALDKIDAPEPGAPPSEQPS